MFENNMVSLDIVFQIGKIIHYDFTQEIKEFSPTHRDLKEISIGYEKKE